MGPQGHSAARTHNPKKAASFRKKAKHFADIEKKGARASCVYTPRTGDSVYNMPGASARPTSHPAPVYSCPRFGSHLFAQVAQEGTDGAHVLCGVVVRQVVVPRARKLDEAPPPLGERGEELAAEAEGGDVVERAVDH